MGLREGENPARWKGHLQNLLPKHDKLSRGHHAALPFVDVPQFLIEVSKRTALAARALELTILTACRTGEVLNANWAEFDLGTAVCVSQQKGRRHRMFERASLDVATGAD